MARLLLEQQLEIAKNIRHTTLESIESNIQIVWQARMSYSTFDLN